MIRKYRIGDPFETEAVTETFDSLELSNNCSESLSLEENTTAIVETNSCFSFTYTMNDTEIIYGLGEAVRGINKRGHLYINYNADDPHHHEDTNSLYGAHNFIIISGTKNIGLFFDYPGEITFDIGYTDYSTLKVSAKKADLYLYVITEDSAYDVVKSFRKMIGRSYIAPKFAFGYGQSRWGYRTKEDFIEVLREHRDNHIPLDMIYMDIDYMDSFKDFTYHKDNFADFPEFVAQMKAEKIHLIPIIDAGVKIEEGYDVYEEGIQNGYFCKKKDGSYFTAAVWPGYTHFPDFLNKEARKWFGHKYKMLLDDGIDGFWNDMNEPAIFHTPEGKKRLQTLTASFAQNDDPSQDDLWALSAKTLGVSNAREDYCAFYHNVDGKMVLHDEVHNLYGYNMTRAAGEAFEELSPDSRVLMFSRSSYIGMHRYGGIWTGDNMSWWSHLLMNIKMMPSLNMCGFLYSGADLGGFGSNTTEDLLLRWLAFGVFTPLMRNHSCDGTRLQEFFRFGRLERFRSIINVRYRLIPYIYSEYMKAVLTDDMLFKPLAFEYPDDEIASSIEDELLLGNEILLTPVYTQNARGRLVYLPEDMMLLRFCKDGSIETKQYQKGTYYISVPLDEVVLFIRSGKCIPIASPAETTSEIDYSSIVMYGYPDSTYELYNDDGLSKDYENPDNYISLSLL